MNLPQLASMRLKWLSPNLPLLRAQAATCAARLGRVGLAGVALIVAALLALAIAAPLMQRQIARAEVANDESQRRLAALAARAAQGPRSSDPVRALHQQLPDAAQLPAFLDSVYAGAARAGLAIERTEYQPQAGVAGVQRFRIVLPVQGAYPALRRWLEQLLAANASAALDELVIRRNGDGVDARVQLSFYWRTP